MSVRTTLPPNSHSQAPIPTAIAWTRVTFGAPSLCEPESIIDNESSPSWFDRQFTTTDRHQQIVRGDKPEHTSRQLNPRAYANDVLRLQNS